MVVQNIDLNMIPESSPVVVHVNQYDVGEGRIVASLYNGAQEYTPASGATAVIQGMKPDGKGFDYNATLSGSTVTANVTEQMTAVEGKTRCQIVITEGNNVTGTFVFYLMVQKSALPADADMSRSEYDVVMQLIEQAEAISTNVPYIGANGNWWVWSVQEEAYVDSGVDASISVDIADITMIAPDATPYVTNTGTNTDPVFHLFIPRGKGISSITKTGTQGLVDTYTITYSDGATTTFTVTNGADGAQGPTGPQGATGPQGPKGDKGDKGDTGTTDAEILIKDTVGWTGKNLLENTASSRTVSGVAVTVNSDGSITLNGTHTASASDFQVRMHVEDIIANGMILSGVPIGASNVKLRISLNQSPWTEFAVDTGNGAAISGYSSQTNVNCNLTLVGNGTVYNNVTVYPMLRKADLTDPTYEPYHADVEQTLRDAEVVEGKNLVDWKVSPTSNALAVSLAPNDYTISAQSTLPNGNWYFRFTDANNAYISDASVVGLGGFTYASSGWFYGGDTIQSRAFKIPSGCKLLEVGKLNSDGTIPAQIEVGTVATSFEPYYIPLKDSKFDRSEQRVLGAKNLLKYPYGQTTKTENGITFTDNGTGTITANGTATAQAKFYLQRREDFFAPPNGRYVASAEGLISGTSIIVEGYTSSARVKNITTLTPSSPSAEIDIDYNGYDRVVAYISVANGTTVNNVRVYPMLRLASDPDSTYAPYAMTNKQLTDNASIKEGNISIHSEATSKITLNSSSYIYSTSGVASGFIRITISSTLTAGQNIITLSIKPKKMIILIAIDKDSNTVMPIIFNENGNVGLFGSNIPTNGHDLIIPFQFITN